MANDSIPEEWRPVEGWPYEVSSYGRVRRSLDSGARPNTWPGRILSPKTDKWGYLIVNMSDAPRQQSFLVHRLVARAFIGAPPSAQHEVAHNDGDPKNNHSHNLRWATSSENNADIIRHGRATWGTRQPNHKLTDNDILAIRKEYSEGGVSQQAIADRIGVHRTQISKIVTGTNWGWLRG